MRIFLCVAMVIGFSACSRADQDKTTTDLKETVKNLPGTIREGTNSLAGAEFQAGVKDLAKDTGKALKEGAKETRQALDNQVEKDKR